MTQGNGQGIGRVGPQLAFNGEQAAHHGFHLRLFRTARANNSQLHFTRGVLGQRTRRRCPSRA